MTRPQLSPGTSHSTCSYEVEWYSKIGGYWALDEKFPDLEEANQRKQFNLSSGIDSRVVVVSETRRLIP